LGYRTDSRTGGQHTNLNHHTSLREELTKQLPLKDRRGKKEKNTTQPPGKLLQSFGLNTNTRTGCWRVTPEPKL
jgi:hypothetical protein